MIELIGVGSLPSLAVPTGPKYGTWTDFINAIAENNGVTKDGNFDNTYNSAARTVETFTTGGGIKITIVSTSAHMVQLKDASTAICSTGYRACDADNPFGVEMRNGSALRTYYGVTQQGDITGGFSVGDTLELRENSGAVEILRNDVVVFTFSQTPFTEFQGKVCIQTPGLNMPNIELTGGVWS